jgi:hypothetical protein
MQAGSPVNTMKRTVNPDSPIWIPLLVNVILLFLAAVVYVYNYSEPPTITQMTKMLNTAVRPI